MRFLRAAVTGTLLLAVILTARAHPILSACEETYRFDTIVGTGSSEIRAEVADDDQERAKGLSERSCLGESHGMLFVFEKPGYYNFWMKDMKFPIDIVWIDGQKRVIDITSSISPSTYPDTFVSSGQPMYVLELKAGQTAEHGIAPGTKLSF